MKVSLNGFNNKVVTFIKEDGADLSKGEFVKLTDNYTVDRCITQDEFVGVCVNVDGDLVSVQVSGFVKTKYVGDDPSIGYEVIATASSTEIGKADTGKKVLIVDRNLSDREVSFIF